MTCSNVSESPRCAQFDFGKVSPPNRLTHNLNFVYTVKCCLMLLYTVKYVGLEKYWNFNCNGFRILSLNVCLTFCSTIWYNSLYLI